MVELASAWRLTGAYFVAQDTGERLDLLGAEPFGYALLDPSGRMVALLTAGGREVGAAGGDLFKSMISYTGRWSVDGDRFVTRVDGAWDPSWIGTEQVRFLTVRGDEMSIRSAPIEHPAFPGQKAVAYVDWRRERS